MLEIILTYLCVVQSTNCKNDLLSVMSLLDFLHLDLCSGMFSSEIEFVEVNTNREHIHVTHELIAHNDTQVVVNAQRSSDDGQEVLNVVVGMEADEV